MKILKSLKRFAPLIAMLVIAAPFAAQAQEKKGVTESELKYQAGASPLASEPMYQCVQSEGAADDAGRVRPRRARPTSSAAPAATACCARAPPASR